MRLSTVLVSVFLISAILLVSEVTPKASPGRRGGVFGSFGRSSSSSGGQRSGGWFSRRTSSTSSGSGSLGSYSRSSYPKQQYGSTGSSTGSRSSYPKQQNTNLGSTNYNRQPSYNPTYSAGGFTKPGTTGIGAGGFGKYNQYSYPRSNSFSSMGSHNFGGKSFGYSKPGYGTRWGTNFANGGKYMGKKGFSKKALGLGVAAGFLGGAALGAAGTMATYGVYHRYMAFQQMMMMRGYGNNGMFDNDYYYNSYRNNVCMGGCPRNSHCEWGFCECNYGYMRKYGQCVDPRETVQPRSANFNPFVTCQESQDCLRVDMNMICNTNLTIQAGGKCACKPGMKWNEQTQDCQIFIDVDCSSITYETKPSPVIMSAVERADERLSLNLTAGANDTALPANRTQSPEESLTTSLLTELNSTQASADELKEAFCRDIDSFSFDLNTDNGKPDLCDEVPQRACAVVYDSHDCSGGWKLLIAEGRISFPYFSSYWKYRNDIDTVGVKEGCVFTGYSGTGFTGNRVVLGGERLNTWYVLEEEAQYAHMENDIESIKCECQRF